MTQQQLDSLTDIERIALEMASVGAVSGTLAEWPVLLSALRNCGYDVTPETTAHECRELLQRIYSGPDQTGETP